MLLKHFKGMMLKGVNAPPQILMIDGWPYVVAVQASPAVGMLQGMLNVQLSIMPCELDEAAGSLPAEDNAEVAG